MSRRLPIPPIVAGTRPACTGSRPSAPLASHLFRILTLTIFLICSGQEAQAAEKLGICYGPASSALVQVAKLRDFYAAEGIDAEMRPFSSGKVALDAMLAGECSLATASEIPVVHHSLSRTDFRILASISLSSNFERIIVRSDRGIHTPADLRGRRVAVADFTSAHYFLDLYLVTNNLTLPNVVKVFLPAQEVVSAFRRGEVDAAAHWEPNIQVLAKEFGTRVKVFAAPSLHISPFLLVGRLDYVRKNPAAIERVLRALLRAERFVKEQPENAKTLMAHDYAGDSGQIELLWPLNSFRVTLDQSLPFILENAARWEIGRLPPAQRTALPNYLDFIYLDGLRAVKAAAVTIIH
jgi:NitT/TauT family transport system substrate-binding protein